MEREVRLREYCLELAQTVRTVSGFVTVDELIKTAQKFEKYIKEG